jgi:hypothetical protein
MAKLNRAYWLFGQTGRTPVATAAPGVGKTQSFYAFCRATGRTGYILVPSMRDVTDFYGAPFADKATVAGEEVSVMRIANPEWAAQCWDGKPHAILLDEMNTGVPAIQNCLLRILAEHVVGEIPLPDGTLIFGAANPPESAATGMELCSALANRVYHHKWVMDKDAILDGFRKGCQFTPPEVDVLPDNWQDYKPLVGTLAACFHSQMPGHLHSEPEDDDAKSKPWPSPRTWEYLIDGLAAVRAANAGKAVELELAAGLVGETTAVTWAKWVDSQDLPDPEVLLAEAISAKDNQRPMQYSHPNRPDKVICMLEAVSAAVLTNNTVVRWQAAMSIVHEAAKREMDTTMAAVRPLARNCPPGAQMPMDLAKHVYPLIQKAFA